MLDRVDGAIEPLQHRLFQRERLDDADALDRLLHRLQHLRAAGVAVPGDAMDAADQLAQHQHGGRRDDEARDRHHRILDHHHRGEADQGQEIAARRRDQHVEHRACRGSSGRHSGNELGGMPRSDEADALVEQLVEYLALILRDDAIADPRQHQDVAVGARSLHREQHDGEDAEPDDAGEILLDVGLVDQLPDQIGGERRAAGGDAHQGERHGVAPPIVEPLLRQQPPHQGRRAVRIGKQGRELRLEHPPSTAESPRIANAGPAPPSPVPCPSRADFSRGNQRSAPMRDPVGGFGVDLFLLKRRHPRDPRSSTDRGSCRCSSRRNCLH